MKRFTSRLILPDRRRVFQKKPLTFQLKRLIFHNNLPFFRNNLLFAIILSLFLAAFVVLNFSGCAGGSHEPEMHTGSGSGGNPGGAVQTPMPDPAGGASNPDPAKLPSIKPFRHQPYTGQKKIIEMPIRVYMNTSKGPIEITPGMIPVDATYINYDHYNEFYYTSTITGLPLKNIEKNSSSGNEKSVSGKQSPESGGVISSSVAQSLRHESVIATLSEAKGKQSQSPDEEIHISWNPFFSPYPVFEAFTGRDRKLT